MPATPAAVTAPAGIPKHKPVPYDTGIDFDIIVMKVLALKFYAKRHILCLNYCDKVSYSRHSGFLSDGKS